MCFEGRIGERGEKDLPPPPPPPPTADAHEGRGRRENDEGREGVVEGEGEAGTNARAEPTLLPEVSSGGQQAVLVLVLEAEVVEKGAAVGAAAAAVECACA